MEQTAVQNPSTAAAVPLPLARDVGVRNEDFAKTPYPPCQGGEGRRSGGGIRLAALLLALALLPLPCFGEALPIQPTLEHFVLGLDRMAGQLQGGHALSALFTVAPGYLPIADRDAANALRQMLTGAQFGYLQRGVGEECEQRLQIWAVGEPVLSLVHRVEENRRLWSCPQLLPETISTPMELNVFAELLGQAVLGESVFALPPSLAAQNAEELLPLQRLMEAAGGSDFVLAPELANRALDVWRRDPAYGPLLHSLISGWRVAATVRVSHKLDERGRLASFQLSTSVMGPDGHIWTLECKGSQGPGRRQYDHKLDVTLHRDKNNTFKLTASIVVTEQAKDRLRQAVKITCNGRLNGHTVELRLNGTLNNRFLWDGATLVEQIDGSYSLDWRGREPALAHLGLDEWKITLGVKGTMRTEAAASSPASPASLEGNVSLTMTRSRRDFLSTGIAFRASAWEHPTSEAPQALLMWERLGVEEQAQLEVWRGLMRRQIAGKLMAGLDTDTRNGIWLK